MFSDKLIAAIQQTSGEFAHELQVEDDENFAEILAETVLDAGRLEMMGTRKPKKRRVSM